MHRTLAAAAAIGLTLGVAGCAQHVTKDELDDEISKVRSQVDENSERISANEKAIEELRSEHEALRDAIDKLRQDFDARIKELEDRLVLSLPVHFEFDRAEVRPVDEPLLDRFASTVREHMSDGVITVEGFADQAGSDAYNERLSRRRAEAVKEYLVSEGNVSGDRIRAVGYGEDRLINEQTGPGRSGIENRRVTFVVEFSGQVGG